MIRHLYLSPAVTHRRYRDPGRYRVPHLNRGVLDYYARPHLRSQHPRGPAADGADLSHARLASLLRLEKVLVCAEDNTRVLTPLQVCVHSARPRMSGRATCGTRSHLDHSERTACRARARSVLCRRPRKWFTSTVHLLSARPRPCSWRETLAHASSRRPGTIEPPQRGEGCACG
jgi:hypothetical protein